MICQSCNKVQSYYQEVPVYLLVPSSGIFLYAQVDQHISERETGIATSSWSSNKSTDLIEYLLLYSILCLVERMCLGSSMLSSVDANTSKSGSRHLTNVR